MDDRSVQSDSQRQLIFSNTKRCFRFAVIVGFACSPLFYLGSLLAFSLPSSAPPVSYEAAAIATILLVIILVFTTFLAVRKITKDKLVSVLYRLPLYFAAIVFIPPVLTILGGLAGMSAASGGHDSGLLVAIGFMFLLMTVVAVTPIFFAALIVYLWLKEKKRLSAGVLVSATIILFLIVFLLRYPLGCERNDFRCVVNRYILGSPPCTLVSSPERCHAEYAITNNNPSYCESIAEEYMQYCKEMYAKFKGFQERNISYCEYFVCQRTEPHGESGSHNLDCLYNKNDCLRKMYLLLAYDTQNPSYCNEAVKHYSWGTANDLRRCYIIIAKKKNDMTICDKVYDHPIEKSICREMFHACTLKIEPSPDSFGQRYYFLDCPEKYP